MKANVGGDRHRVLKQFAIKEAIKVWGDRVFVVTQECDRFSLNVSAGVGNYDIKAEKEIFPDLMMLLADGVRKTAESYRNKEYVNPQLVIVECENSRQSTLVRGTHSVRLFAYLLLKERYKHVKGKGRPVFVLVTWDGNRDVYKDVGMWDYVWFLPGEAEDVPVEEDAPIDVEE